MGIARIDHPDSTRQERNRHGLIAEGEGFLWLAMVAGSWAATAGLGWVIWRVLAF